MKYVFQQPSLQQIAEMKIVSELWNQEDILIEIAKINFPSTYPVDEANGNWIAIERGIKNRIRETVSAFPLPKPLRENLVNLINPLSLEVRDWGFFHKDLVLKMPNEFCWTPRGTIDNKKTAELIVKDENVDIETRYTMACTYCFENEIPILWQRIPETRKEMFKNLDDANAMRRHDPRNFRKDLVTFWTYFINDKLTELHQLIQKMNHLDTSPYVCAFKLAAFGFNRSASKFFFEKLSCEEKNRYLAISALVVIRGPFHSCKMETVLFLLNQMSEEQQEKVFNWRMFDVFSSMLDWPYQPFFLEMAKKWFHFLLDVDFKIDKCRYSYSFNKICDKIKRDERDYDYKLLFREFWLLVSGKDIDFFQKEYILLNLIELYEAKEVELVKYVLNRATNFQKQQLIYSTYIEEYKDDNLPLLIDLKKWDFLRFLLGECITCKEMLINFESYLTWQLSKESDAESKTKLITAFEIVVDLIRK